MWTCREGRARFCSEVHIERIRGSRHKFQQGKFQLGMVGVEREFMLEVVEQ